MRLRKLNFAFVDGFREALLEVGKSEIIFIRPLHSKMFRVYQTPLNCTQELPQVLTTLCTRYHKGVWYFRVRDDDTWGDICSALHYMNYDNLVVEPSPNLN